ncbi:zinc ribbon domain-containing protein [Candidatus Venteria ishoeyi]|uniref:Tellurite resistance protein TerB n=1 Tax=Candidatus Venteria ishoeyi TaxID=1899563 RepID=A0A1H6F333_9GAMM|nr:zinc ribbon domain-containing protein [Candidatus Venteria ishoeyi]SEH04567.1 Uncharacterised protein [Candidatus Venteria ishoeyi]
MILSNKQKVDYLTNIIGLVRADGKITPQESEAIGFIQKVIGARKTELNKAYKNAEIDGIVPQLVGFWSDQIKNLEHIIYVSLIDGEIDSTEKHYILQFAKQVKINQEQLNYIIGDVKRLVSNTTQEIVCSNCDLKINSSAKFCPECGQSIEEIVLNQSVAVSYEVPSTGIAIEFAKSTAVGFSMAVKSMKIAPISKECIKGKKQWYLAWWPKEEIAKALELVENLNGIRNRKVYVDGEELQWNDVFDFYWCANSRKSAYRPTEYCFGMDEKRLNIWGCKKARMDWSNRENWFGYGSFKKSGMHSKSIIFEFDKQRIRHNLETNLYGCHLCPHLQFDLIEAVLDSLPNEVTPTGKGPWQYKRDYSESPGAVFVTETVRDGGHSYTNEYYSSGVRPSSVYVGLEILKKAFSRCNTPKEIKNAVLEYKE